MEVMPAGTRFLRAISRAFGDPQGTRWLQSKNPAEWPGRGPETLSHSGRGDAAEGSGHTNSLARAKFRPRALSARPSEGRPRDAHVAGTPLRGPATMDSRLRGNERSLQLRRSAAARASYRLAQLHRAFEVDRDELGDAALRHRDAVEPIHARHGDRIVGDDHEARVGRARHLVEQVAEALDIVIVERRVDLAQLFLGAQVDSAEPLAIAA